ncbi:MAG: GNAT family N-acetyltransferase [Ignavibacteria bacterium]|nr:GNAT family N-acetyltransferase [Ignavibacteria bacterium]
MRIVLLDRTHDREGFDCGEVSLNAFLKQHARKNAELGFSVTYVLTADDSNEILAYYTIAGGEFDCELLPATSRKGLPRHAVPVIRLCRLATDLTQRGKGLGEIMLLDVLRRAVSISEQLGVHAIEVDALSDAARTYYRKYGFQSLLNDPAHLYLAIETARRLLPDRKTIPGA